MRAGMVLESLAREFDVTLRVVPIVAGAAPSVSPRLAKLCARVAVHRQAGVDALHRFATAAAIRSECAAWARLADRGEVETEGLGIMAHAMGHQCWGLPHVEIRHARCEGRRGPRSIGYGRRW
jgi:hypothetical protein